jgi:hypothetical protein
VLKPARKLWGIITTTTKHQTIMAGFQLTRGAAILDLVCASILLPFAIFMTCSFFGIHFGFQIRNVAKAEGNSQRKRSLQKSTASIRPTAKASGWKSTPDTIWLTLAILVFSIAASCSNATQKLNVNPRENFTLCKVAARAALAFFFLGKLTTLAFLGIRTAKVYSFGDSWSHKWISRNLVIAVTWIFSICFLGLAISTFFDAVVQVDPILIEQEICISRVPLVVNSALNVVDGMSSGVLLILYVVPLREVAESLKSEHKSATDRDYFGKLAKENAIYGSVTIFFAFACSLWVTILLENPVDLSVFAGSLRNVDLMINCIMQFYAVRNYWSRKKHDQSDNNELKTPLASSDYYGNNDTPKGRKKTKSFGTMDFEIITKSNPQIDEPSLKKSSKNLLVDVEDSSVLPTGCWGNGVTVKTSFFMSFLSFTRFHR